MILSVMFKVFKVLLPKTYISICDIVAIVDAYCHITISF